MGAAGAAADVRAGQTREVRLPEFAKLAPEFDGRSSDPVDAENWVTVVEKAFSAFEVLDRLKIPMAEF